MARQTWWVIALVASAWGAALVFSAASGRSLYGDGALFVLKLLLDSHRFFDYDPQRSFASFLSQAPILLGQRAGLTNVAAYAALYSAGVSAVPASVFLAALVLARQQPALFAANAAALVIFGFGANFINTEANLLFALSWLAATILALGRSAPLLRGAVLPAIGLVLLRTYEGMILVGPILALWAYVTAAQTQSERERIGLMIAAFLFALGAVVGVNGFLAPRDPSNASGFVSSIFRYISSPQAFLCLSACLGMSAVLAPTRGMRTIFALLSATGGTIFLISLVRETGYFAYVTYYHNRSFLVLCLPVAIGAVFIIDRVRRPWLEGGLYSHGYAPALIPLAFAVFGDIYGTIQWRQFVVSFCEVLEQPLPAAERLALLKQSGARTGWAWTHPTMSLLLRPQGSVALVANDPGQFEPDVAKFPSDRYRGLCEAPLGTRPRPPTFGTPLQFNTGKYPFFVAHVRGLSHPEGWATWSIGSIVEIQFMHPLPTSFDLTLSIASVYEGNLGQPIKVQAGSTEMEFVAERPALEVTLPFRNISETDRLAVVIPRPQSPLELGKGDDSRKLGLAFVSMKIIRK